MKNEHEIEAVANQAKAIANQTLKQADALILKTAVIQSDMNRLKAELNEELAERQRNKS